MSVLPKHFEGKAEGTLIWTENAQPSDKVSVSPEDIYEQMIV